MVRISSKEFRGFTIVELLVVIVVIAVLATVSIVSYQGIQQSARDKSILSDLDALDGLETQYGLKNSVAGKAWYSGDGIDMDLNFTPSSGNVIDIVVNATDYCIRGYNPSATKNSIHNAHTKGSSQDACSNLQPSISEPGWITWSSPVVSTGTGNTCVNYISASSDLSTLISGCNYRYATSTNLGTSWTRTSLASYGTATYNAISNNGTVIYSGFAGDNSSEQCLYRNGYIKLSATCTVANPRNQYIAMKGDDSIVIIGTNNNNTISRSVNSGSNWVGNIKITGGTGGAVSNLAISRNANICGGIQSGQNVGISTDGCSTWSTKYSFGANIGSTGSYIRISDDGTKVVVAVKGNNIIASSDSGQTWNDLPSSGANQWSSLAISGDGQKIAAVTSDTGHLYTSYDFGGTWVDQTSNLSGEYAREVVISSDGSKIIVRIVATPGTSNTTIYESMVGSWE